jgi:hypothetical protein
MATPAFGTYYLVQPATTGVAATLSSQVLAAMPLPPSSFSSAPSAASSDTRPSDRLHGRPLIASRASPLSQHHCRYFLRRLGSRASHLWNRVRAAALCFTAAGDRVFSFLLTKVCRTTAPPVLKPENNTASAAWSKQQPLEMQPQTLAREAAFGQPSRRSHAL